MKFRKHISGMKDKNGKAYASGYDARIPKEVLTATGFLKEDGTTLEYDVSYAEINGFDKMVILLTHIERSEGK
jgi:hypothetical protein